MPAPLARALVCALGLTLAACASSPQPVEGQVELRTGEETAAASAKAARKALAAKSDGTIVASGGPKPGSPSAIGFNDRTPKSRPGVNVYAKPRGEILIDGKPTGRTTPASVPLSPGKYKVQVRFLPEGTLSKTKTISLRANGSVKLFFRDTSPAFEAIKVYIQADGKAVLVDRDAVRPLTEELLTERRDGSSAKKVRLIVVVPADKMGSKALSKVLEMAAEAGFGDVVLQPQPGSKNKAPADSTP